MGKNHSLTDASVGDSPSQLYRPMWEKHLPPRPDS